MKLRSQYIAAIAIIAHCVVVVAHSQPREWTPGAAAHNSGTVSSRSGGALVARALYVSLRSSGATRVEAVALARLVGLDPIEATSLSFVRQESPKDFRASLQSLPRERRARVEQ